MLTVMIAGSTLGNSLTPRYVRPTNPNSSIMIAKTVANTGLLMLVEERLISGGIGCLLILYKSVENDRKIMPQLKCT